MLKPRCGHASASSTTKAFVFGGLTDCGNGTTTGPGLEAYDVASKTWSTVADTSAPTPRYNSAMIWTGTELFLFGGSTNAAPAVSSAARFNPTTSAWTNATCGLPSCERVGGTLFVDGPVVRYMGGGYGDAPAGRQYTLGTGVWSAWAAPAASDIPGRFGDDGRRIYFLGGTGTGCSGSVEVRTYDRKSGSWLATDKAAAPTGVYAGAAEAWSGSELLVWGGSCDSMTTVATGARYQPPAPPP